MLSIAEKVARAEQILLKYCNDPEEGPLELSAQTIEMALTVAPCRYEEADRSPRLDQDAPSTHGSKADEGLHPPRNAWLASLGMATLNLVLAFRCKKEEYSAGECHSL